MNHQPSPMEALAWGILTGQPVATNPAQASELIANENREAANAARAWRPKPKQDGEYSVTLDGNLFTITAPDGEQTIVRDRLIADPSILKSLLGCAYYTGRVSVRNEALAKAEADVAAARTPYPRKPCRDCDNMTSGYRTGPLCNACIEKRDEQAEPMTREDLRYESRLQDYKDRGLGGGA